MRRRNSFCLVLFLALVFGILFGTVCVSANSFTNVNRISGKTRYDTAYEIAKAAFPNGAKEAVLVSGANFPDALSAAGYAGSRSCPILITAPKSLSAQTKKLLLDWKVTDVTIIGGTPSVSQAVADALENECSISSDNIRRIFGRSRQETAEKVEAAGNFDTAGACVIASGAKAADALSISPWCYKNKWPILLADAKGNLSASSLSRAKKYARVYLLGSESSVSASVAESLPQSQRIAGKNRYATSVDIAQKFAVNYEGTAFSSGRDNCFPDPLVGSQLAGKNGVPLVLADGLSGPEFDFVDSSFGQVRTINLLGSEKSLTKITENRLRGIRFGGIFTLTEGVENKVRLNGDGNTDTISYKSSYGSNGYLNPIQLTVNGTTVSARTNKYGSTPHLYAADINIGDGWKNIFVDVIGEDDDDSLLLYAYNGSDIHLVKTWGISKNDYLCGNIAKKSINGLGGFSFGVVEGWHSSVNGVWEKSLSLRCNDYLDGDTVTEKGTAAGYNGSGKYFEYDADSFHAGYEIRTIAAIPCYADSTCTERAISLPKGVTVPVTGYRTGMNMKYNLRISYAGRTLWLRGNTLGKSNIEGYTGES